MSDEFQSAREICEAILDRTTAALLAGDFDAFAQCFTMPTKVETFEGSRILSTLEELRDAFEGVCAHYMSLGTTDIVRHIVAAEFVDETKIRATHETRVLAKNDLVQAPFAVHSTYIAEETMWKVSESIYIVENAPLYTRAISKGHSKRMRVPE
ncbi:MAG: hypothetical protein AAGI10_11445 [Pseudomonadota bacterium]